MSTYLLQPLASERFGRTFTAETHETHHVRHPGGSGPLPCAGPAALHDTELRRTKRSRTSVPTKPLCSFYTDLIRFGKHDVGPDRSFAHLGCGLRTSSEVRCPMSSADTCACPVPLTFTLPNTTDPVPRNLLCPRSHGFQALFSASIVFEHLAGR